MAEIVDAGDQPTPTMRHLWDADPFLREAARLLFGAAATAGAATAEGVRGQLRTEPVVRGLRRPTVGGRSATNDG